MRIFGQVVMLLTFVVAALAAGAVRPRADLSNPMNGFAFKYAPKIAKPANDQDSLQFSRLKRIKGHPTRRPAISAMDRAHPHGRTEANGVQQNVTTIQGFSTQYAVECEWDGVSVPLILDTGSSDTWAAKKGFECKDDTGKVRNQQVCAFGGPYIDGFGQGKIDDMHFYLKYGSGEEIWGPMGYSDITCGGLTVSRQQVGLANHTYWQGNNITAGILGMAYPSLTSAFYGPIGDEAPWNAIGYPPLLTTAISQGSMEPVFSVAIMKNSTDGVLAWGGLPPVPYNRQKFAATDLIIANLIEQEETAWKYSFYTIILDGVRWGTTTDEAKYPYVVDTGTTLMYLPPPLAESIAQAFEPQAVYLYQWGSYFVECDAIAPEFAVIIEGVEFRINSSDLIYRELVDPLTGYCSIGIASGGSGPYILGDVFLQNVVAVFDVGAAEMRFYARK